MGDTVFKRKKANSVDEDNQTASAVVGALASLIHAQRTLYEQTQQIMTAMIDGMPDHSRRQILAALKANEPKVPLP